MYATETWTEADTATLNAIAHRNRDIETTLEQAIKASLRVPMLEPYPAGPCCQIMWEEW